MYSYPHILRSNRRFPYLQNSETILLCKETPIFFRFLSPSLDSQLYNIQIFTSYASFIFIFNG